MLRRTWPQPCGGARRSALPAIEPRAARRGRCRCRSRSSGCGSWSSWTAAAAAYHMPLGLRLTGALDRAALRRALDRIVARHEALRTSFVLDDGAAGAAHRAGGHRLRAARSTTCAATPTRRPRSQALAAQEAERRLRPGARPADPRPAAACWATQEHVLLVTMHHIVSDGWSMGVLTRELSALYGAFAEGRADPLPPLPIQYADYAAWQRRWLEGEVLQRQGDYWKRPPGRRAGAAGAAHRPAAPGAAGLPRRDAWASSWTTTLSRGAEGAQPAPWHHAVHDAAGRLGRAAGPPVGPGRRRDRHAGRQPHAAPRSKG